MKSFFSRPWLKSLAPASAVARREMALGYFVGPFLAFVSNATFSAYLNRYYSDVLGWTDASRFGAFSTLLPMVSVVFVILGNLWVGRKIDTTRTAQGKARPYLLVSLPLVVVAIALLFLSPLHVDPAWQMVWIAVSYNLYYALAYPFFYASHSSMVALSTRDSSRRGILATLSNASGVAAVGLGASILIPVFFQSYLFASGSAGLDPSVSYHHWQVVMTILCGTTGLGILIEYFFTRERITEENSERETQQPTKTLGTHVRACVSTPAWWLIIGTFFLFQLGGLVKNGSMSYYARWMFDSVHDEAAAGVAMGLLGLIGGIPTALGMVIAWPLAKRLGKKRSIVAGLILSVVGGAVSFLDIHSFTMVCVGVVLKGIGSIPVMYVTLALLSDVLDHLEAKNGFRSDGFTMSVYGAIMVGLTGLGSGIINGLLTVSGYVPTATAQSAPVQSMLALAYLGVELVCYLAIIIILSFLHVERTIEKDQEVIRTRQAG